MSSRNIFVQGSEEQVVIYLSEMEESLKSETQVGAPIIIVLTWYGRCLGMDTSTSGSVIDMDCCIWGYIGSNVAPD